MAGFIEDDSQSDSSGRHGSDSDDDRPRKHKPKKQSRGSKPKGPGRSGFGASMVEGITAEAWQEVTDVFGNGTEYADALQDDADGMEDKALRDVRPLRGLLDAQIRLTHLSET